MRNIFLIFFQFRLHTPAYSLIFACEMMKYTIVLSIAGSDCSGGAGIQADIKTLSALGCYAASVITAVTVQNTCGVRKVYPIPPQAVAEQLQAVSDDMEIDAIKIGMVTDEGIINVLADFLVSSGIPSVFDPVLISSSGFPLVTPKSLELIRDRLIPLCTLVTPNLREAEVLSGYPICKTDDMAAAGLRILSTGCKAVLVKGGHLDGNDMRDLLVTGTSPQDLYSYHAAKIDSPNTHGTGCTLSSAIAAYMAQHIPLPQAVALGKEYLTQALSAGKDIAIGKGHGPLNHFFEPKKLMVK